MFEITKATYNITDNRLKFWPADRLSDEDYKRAKGLNFQWWPGRKCFSTIWSPYAEDFIKSAGAEIEADDSPDDIEGRIERFQKYAAQDEQDAAAAVQRAIEATTTRRAEAAEGTADKKAAEALYWQRRIAGAIGRAEYRDRPDVIARRIKGLEADLRKHNKEMDIHVKYDAIWRMDGTTTIPGRAKQIANVEPGYFSMKFAKADYPNSTYEGDKGIWSALNDGTINAEQAQRIMAKHHREATDREFRWINHLNMRLEYERAYLGASGGSPADKLTELKPGDSVMYNKEVCTVIKINRETVRIDQPSWHWLKNGHNVAKTELTPVEV